MKLTRNHFVLPVLAVLAVLCIANLMGAPLVQPETLAAIAASLGAMPFAFSGEVTMPELKSLIEKQNEAYGEFTRKNDELLKAKAEGKAVSELTATVTGLNAELSKLTADMVKLAAKAQRPENEGPDAKLTDAQREYKTAFTQFLRKGTDNGLADLQQKAYVSGSNPDGGFLVLPEMDMQIDRVVSVVSALGRLADNRTVGTDTYKKWVKTAGMTARRVGPGATGGETTNPKWTELAFTAHEAEAEPWIHNSTLEDAVVNLEADLAGEAAIAFAEMAGLELCQGTGVGQAFGVTTGYSVVANASYSFGKVGYIASGAAGAFAGSNPGDAMIALQHGLKSQYRPGAAWIMGDSTLMPIRQMKDGSGAYYLWQPDPLAGFGGRLLGSPVEVDDNMPVVAANSLSIGYGNWKAAYVVVNRSGTTVIRDHITQKGVTKFNFRKRIGGGVKNFEAYKLMKFAAS